MAKTIWTIDPTHSEIGFKVKHMMFTNVSGKFSQFEASIESDEDNFETASIQFKVNVASIDTANGDRDNHLRGTDFFDVEKFPVLSFASESVKKISTDSYQVTGDFTIKDVTKKITLNAEYSGLMKDPWGNTRAGFSLSGAINRKEFGLTWNAALETGGVLVGEEVKLLCEIQLIKQ